MNDRITAALLVLCACGRVVETNEVEVAAGRQELRDCRYGGSSDGIIIGNSLDTDSLIYNTLLMDPASNAALSMTSLSSSSFATIFALHDALTMPQSRTVMEYLVGCALSESDPPVVWIDGKTKLEFRGEIGLCSSWASGRPSDECLQAVSACLLARNNHRGIRVPISLRGDDSRYGVCVAASSRVRPWPQPTRSSYEACPRHATGPRDCGWRSEGVWKCSPGSSVALQSNSCAVGAAPGDRMLRVCEGISACDGAAALAGSTPAGCGSIVAFTCPSSGKVSALSAPYDTAVDVPEPITAYGADLLDERDLFSIREGAFYGTMFGKDSVSYPVVHLANGSWTPAPWTVVGSPKVIFPLMFTCADAAWTEPLARTLGYAANGRICVFGRCASEYTGVCQLESGAGCDRDPYEAIEQTEMRACRDRRGRAWKAGLTSYLREPCELDDPQFPKLCIRK